MHAQCGIAGKDTVSTTKGLNWMDRAFHEQNISFSVVSVSILHDM